MRGAWLWRDETTLARDARRLVLGAALAAVALAWLAPLAAARVALAHLPLAAALAALALALPGTTPRQRPAAVALVIAGGLLAAHGWRELGAPAAAPGVALAAAGAAVGALLALGLLPRHARPASRRVRRAHAGCARALAGAADAEVAALVTRAEELWGRVEAADHDAPAVRAGLEEAVARLLSVATRWAAAAAPGALPGPAAIAARLAELASAEARCTDETARRELALARAALEAQQRHLDEMQATRRRVLAQLQRYLAVAEQLHLAALGQRTADAAHHAAAVWPLLDDLGRLGEDLDHARAAAAEPA